jgi:hypothetical protein
MLNVLKQNLNITQGFLTFPIVYKKSLRTFKKSCPKIFFFFYCIIIILKYFFKGKKRKRILTFSSFKCYNSFTNICHKEDKHMANNEVEIIEAYAAQIKEAAAAKAEEEAKVKYKDIDLDYIIKYCQEQGSEAVAWLKETAQKKVNVKVYPRVQQEKDGKTISVADTTKEPKVEERKITFIQLKKAFVEKFMPDIMPKSKKKESMYDIIAAL